MADTGKNVSAGGDSLMAARVGATVTHKPVVIEWKKGEAAKTFVIKPLCLGVLLQMAEEITLFETEAASSTDESVYAMLANSAILARVVARIMMASEEPVAPELVEWLSHNLTGSELLRIIAIMVGKNDVSAFLEYYHLDELPGKRDEEDSHTISVNTPWTLIGSVCKYFRFSYEYTLFGISYCNLMMLLNTIPVYHKKGDEEKEEKVVDGMVEVDSAEDFRKLGL